MAINKPFVAKHGLAIANTTHIVFNPDGTLHANNANVQVSLDTSTLVTNANFQSVVANTNLAITDRMQVANTVALVNDRIQVANADTRFLRKDGTDSQSVGGQVTFDNNVVISGNLTVSGTRTEVNTTQVNVSNTYILLNSDLGPGDAATENAGLIINRGAEANVYFRWNETDEHFEWGEADGTFRKITDAAATVVQVRNESGTTIPTGSPVYVTGYSAGGSKPLIDIADADDAAKMPALGITLAEVTNNSNGLVGTYGVFSEANTGVFSEGDELYIDTVAGKLTATRPTGSTTKIQKIGQVLRSHASAGSILIQGAGRSNDIPNLQLSQVFIGNTSGVGEARQLTVSDLSDADTLATNSAFQSALANTNTRFANFWPSSNVITYTGKYLEVANAASSVNLIPYWPSSNIISYVNSNVNPNNTISVNVAPQPMYARLTLTSATAGTTSQQVVIMTGFNTRDIDTSPSNALTSTLGSGKFIIPAGVTKVRVRGSARTSSVTDQVAMKIMKNGSNAISTNFDISSTGQDFIAAFSGIEEVVQGDYFQLAVFSQSGTRTVNQDSDFTWFEIEVLEGSMVNRITHANFGNLVINSLTDVDTVLNAPTDGQALLWNSANGKWEPSDISTQTGSLVSNTYFQSFVANNNSYIATKTGDATALSTNTALRTLIADRIQVANVITLTNKYLEVANAASSVNLVPYWPSSNVITYTGKYLEVANAASSVNLTPYWPSSNVINYIDGSLSGSEIKITHVPVNIFARLDMTSDEGMSGSTGNYIDNLTTVGFDNSPNQVLTANSTNGTMSVPTDGSVTKVRLTASIMTLNIAGQSNPIIHWFDSSGSRKYSGGIGGSQQTDTAGDDGASLITGILPVANGDYFRLNLYATDAGTALAGNGRTYLEMQVMEGSMLANVQFSNVSFSALSDVDVTTTAPTDGQTLVFNAANSTFIPGDAGGAGEVANAYLTSTYVTNTGFQSALANTNLAIADRMQVANVVTLTNKYLEVANVVTSTANTEDITNQLFKTKQLSTTRTFTVTVGTKTISPWAGGSSSAYFIDGEEVPSLTLVPGFTYRFDQSDASNSSHPISFYREADKTTSYVTGVGGTGTAGSSGAYTEIQVSANTPMSLFYQCQNHGYMGGQIATVSDTSPKYVEQSNVTVTLGSYWPSSNIISYINTNAGGVTNTNFQSYVANTNSRLTSLEGSSGVSLASFSVSTGTPTGGGSLAYNDQNGTFTFRPSGAFPTISTTAPSLSGNGTLWFDSEDASLFIEYDGNWVSAAPVVGSSPNNFISYSGNNTLRLVTGDGEFIDADMAQIGAAGGASGTDTDLTGSARAYTANGSVTDFLAAFARDNPEDVFVTVDGITQRPTTQYTISGTTVSFGTPPANNAVVMIRTFNGLLGTNTASIDVNKYTANGTQTTGFFSPSNSALVNDLIVTINGVVQKPTTDYTLSAQTVTFATAPVAASDIAIRALRTRIAAVTEISQYVFSNSTVVTSANSNLDSNILVATYNANGTATSFAANTNSITLDTSIVSVSGLLQRPVTDYTLSGNNIVFGTAPANNDVVSVREFRHPATLTQIQMNIVPWQEISSNGAVLSNYNYFVDCSAEPITITLPSVKNQGDTIKIIDATGKASNNNITVNGAGSKIMGDAADFTVADDRAAFTLVYYNTQQGWILGEV